MTDNWRNLRIDPSAGIDAFRAGAVASFGLVEALWGYLLSLPHHPWKYRVVSFSGTGFEQQAFEGHLKISLPGSDKLNGFAVALKLVWTICHVRAFACLARAITQS